MYRRILLALVATMMTSVAIAADQGRGNSNNPNTQVVPLAWYNPIAGLEFLTAALCANVNPGVSNNKSESRYGPSQGDEGLNKAFNVTLCLVLTDAPHVVVLDEVHDWPSDGCTGDGNPWDPDALPHEDPC